MKLIKALTLIPLFVLLVACAAPTPSPTLTPTPTPDIAPALSKAAQLAEARQYSAAIAALQDAAQLNANNPQPIVEIGNITLKQHRWELAQQAFEEALDLQPDNYDAAIGLGEALLGQGKTHQAKDIWRKAIDLDDARFEGYLGLGKSLLATRKFNEAQQAFADALKRSPKNSQALWYLAALALPTDAPAGEAWLRQIDPPTATGDYLLATLDALPDNAPQAQTATLVGIALTQLAEWELALRALETATQLDPNNATAWAFLGYAQASLGLPALDSLDRAAELEPDSALPLYFKGVYLRQKEHYDLAIDYFLKAIELDPGNIGVMLETARTLADKGDYLSAEAWYRTIAESDPDSVEYQQQLTEFFVTRSYRIAEKGLPEAEGLVKLAPDNARAFDLLGWAKFQTGDFGGAEESLRLAADLAPNDVAIRYHLGKTLKALHKNVDAQIEFQHALDWDTSGTYRKAVKSEK
ncbi:MAG TPA: tetratricopeptide repeat protein [Chloroflexi bacterium]|nr:tetratricopeptide repeat protein [Chloroflexota bacterium]